MAIKAGFGPPYFFKNAKRRPVNRRAPSNKADAMAPQDATSIAAGHILEYTVAARP